MGGRDVRGARKGREELAKRRISFHELGAVQEKESVEAEIQEHLL